MRQLGFQNRKCFLCLMQNTGMGNVDLPALADALLLRCLGHPFDTVSKASPDAGDGQTGAVGSLCHDGCQMDGLADIGNQRRETATATQIVEVRREEETLGGVHFLFQISNDFRNALVFLAKSRAFSTR